MDAIVGGIDISKDQLDVAGRPGGAHFVVARTPQGLRELIERLQPPAPVAVGVEVTGGYETVVVADPAAAGLPVAWSTRPRCAPSPRHSIGAPRQIRSMPT